MKIYNKLKKEADAANTPQQVCEAINHISEAWVNGTITEEQDNELVLSMYERIYGRRAE